MKKDYLVRGMVYQDYVRVFAVQMTETLEEIRKRLDTYPVVSAALGRTLAVSAMMGAMVKGEDRLSIVVKGDGPIGKILVDANGKGEVRGYVSNPHVEFPLNEKGKLDVRAAVGKEGTIIVTKDLGLKDPYQGSSPIVSGEIGEDFAYYFTVSEQIPSAVGVGVLVNPDYSIKSCGGFIFQVMPDTPEEVIAALERDISQIRPVSAMVNDGLTPEEMLKEITGQEAKILGELPIVFKCHCSRQRVESALISLGKEELQAMIDEENEAEIQCHFCNEKYHVSREELAKLINVKH
ncbi:MAG TPA: Hsp33 family molecular chaperone HslO [Paenibacillaceae bacterium]|nr:Hsp33 family molecular chaperone HslO [Paenibacillaceae bacterium]